MSGGLVLLGIIGLFFLAMYLYAYGTTNYAVRKEEKAIQRRLIETQEKEEAIKLQMLERQKEREEKYRISNARSIEIQQELERLKQQREAIKA